MAIVNAEVRFAPKLTAWFTANPTKVLQDGEIVYCSDGANIGKYVIGDNSTQLSALTFYGGLSSSGLTIGTTTITSGTNTRILYNNAGVVGEYLVTGTGTTAVLSTSPVFTTDITTPLIKGVGGFIQTFSTDAVNIGNKTTTSQRIVRIGQDTAWIDVGSAVGFTSYSAMYFNTTTPALTTYAIASNGIDMLLNAPGTNGAISLRTENNIRMTVNKNGASHALVNIDFLVGANTNQTLSTHIPSFRVQGASKQWATGTLATQYFNHFTANTVAFVGASTATLVASAAFDYTQGGTNSTVTTSAAIYVPTLVLTNTTTGIGLYVVAPSGATNNYAARFEGNTIMTGSLNVVGITNTGNATFSGFLNMNSQPIRFLAGTAASPALYFETNTVGIFSDTSNVLGFSTSGTSRITLSTTALTISDAYNLAFNTTTGSKIGTATTQKIGFWNATPIIQPTTLIAASTLTSNGGTTLTSTDTIDGYTLLQVVKALRNTGLLA